MIVLCVLCLLAGLSIFAVEGFTIREVEVRGNELYTDEQIKASVLNDEYSWNALYVMVKHRLFNMEEVPFIDEMEIEMLSRNKIKINVYEKAIIGYIEANDQNVYFDKDGFVVEISKRLIEDVAKVEGITCRKVIVYEKLNLDDENALTLLLTFSQQLGKYGLKPDVIIFNEKRHLSAKFGRITVLIGNSDYLVEKAMRLNSIMPELTGKSGILHLENWSPVDADVVFEPAK